MALANLHVQLARPMVGSGVAERPVIGSCITTRSTVGSYMMTIPMVGTRVVQKHTQSMLQLLNLVYAVCTWKSGRLNQIVDVPVPQIEKERVEANQWVHYEHVEANQWVHHERVEANQLVPQECTQQHDRRAEL